MSRQFVSYNNPKDPFYIVQMMSSLNRDEMVTLMCESVISSNPLRVALGMTPEQLRPYHGKLYDKAIREGLSAAAIHRDTGAYIGFYVGEDAATGEPIKVEPDEPMAIFVALNSLLRYEHDRAGPVQPGDVCRGIISGIRPEFRRLGVFNALMIAVFFHLHQVGYRRYFGTATHPATQMMTERASVSEKTLQKRVDLKTFEFPPGSGQFPWKDVPISPISSYWLLRESEEPKL